MIKQNINIAFYFVLLIYSIVLLFASNSLGISSKEIDIFYNQEDTILWYLTHISTHFLGTNNIGIRLPFILFYILSIILAYLLTDDYFTKSNDRIYSIIIFMLLPGLNSAALLVNLAVIIIFCVLLYLYLFKLYGKEYYLLLILFLFIDNSFIVLYLALFIYSFKKQDRVLLIVSLLLFFSSIFIYGTSVSGHPRGYLLDTFGMYASIFSPILFLYFFYTLYKVSIKGEKDLYWYISFTALILSLIFSLRQRVDISDFAPYVVIAVPLMVKTFLHSYRVRLKIFRIKHKIFANSMIVILFLNTMVLLFNKPLYAFIDNPQRHFAYKFHIVDNLAKKLKELNINEVKTSNKKLKNRLDYYGVTNGNKYILSDIKTPIYYKKIDIIYYHRIIKTYYILLQK